jgi:nucleoside-diphosphate kinase
MAVERTLSIVKPDGVARNLIGDVYRRFERAGLAIIGARMLRLTQIQAEGFYAVHRARPFFKDLVDFMISGPVMVQALEGDNAIQKNRDLMGATDPKKAEKGTIRADFAQSIDANAVHGSDGLETAQGETLAGVEVLPHSRVEPGGAEHLCGLGHGASGVALALDALAALAPQEPGWAEADPRQWWQNVCAICHDLLAAARATRERITFPK